MKKVLTDGKVNFVEEKNMGQRELAYEINKKLQNKSVKKILKKDTNNC